MLVKVIENIYLCFRVLCIGRMSQDGEVEVVKKDDEKKTEKKRNGVKKKEKDQ